MSDYTIGVTLDRPYHATVAAVRDSLAEQGSGVLTEIDEAMDPDAMTRPAAADATLREVATEARGRLVAALAALEGAR